MENINFGGGMEEIIIDLGITRGFLVARMSTAATTAAVTAARLAQEADIRRLYQAGEAEAIIASARRGGPEKGPSMRRKAIEAAA